MMAFPRAGSMTAYITIQRRQADGSWADSMRVYAEYLPAMGREMIAADSTQPVATGRYRMRYRADLANADPRTVRIIHNDIRHNVTYIENDSNRNVQLYLVTERAY